MLPLDRNLQVAAFPNRKFSSIQYMDLFNQYAQSTLESLNSRLSQQLLALEKL